MPCTSFHFCSLLFCSSQHKADIRLLKVPNVILFRLQISELRPIGLMDHFACATHLLDSSRSFNGSVSSSLGLLFAAHLQREIVGRRPVKRRK